MPAADYRVLLSQNDSLPSRNKSWRSAASFRSAASVLALASVLSALSAGSFLSAGSVLSVASVASVASVLSVASVGCIGGFLSDCTQPYSQYLDTRNRQDARVMRPSCGNSKVKVLNWQRTHLKFTLDRSDRGSCAVDDGSHPQTPYKRQRSEVRIDGISLQQKTTLRYDMHYAREASPGSAPCDWLWQLKCSKDHPLQLEYCPGHGIVFSQRGNSLPGHTVPYDKYGRILVAASKFDQTKWHAVKIEVTKRRVAVKVGGTSWSGPYSYSSDCNKEIFFKMGLYRKMLPNNTKSTLQVKNVKITPINLPAPID